MPELPEVETLVRSLRPHLVARRIVAVTTSGLPLRQPLEPAALRAAAVGATIESVERVGKYFIIALDGEMALLGHLGMSGRLLVVDAAAPLAPHTHARLRLSDARELRLVDPRRFGLLVVRPRAALLASAELALLGVDPLSSAFTPAYLAEALAASRRDLKAFLMDQSKLAGLGNIYVCEALFGARLSPTKRSDRARAHAAPLHDAIRAALGRGLAARGTSFSDYVDADGAPGEHQHGLAVYGREGQPCRVCRATVRRRVQAGRSTFYCPRCQR